MWDTRFSTMEPGHSGSSPERTRSVTNLIVGSNRPRYYSLSESSNGSSNSDQNRHRDSARATSLPPTSLYHYEPSTVRCSRSADRTVLQTYAAQQRPNYASRPKIAAAAAAATKAPTTATVTTTTTTTMTLPVGTIPRNRKRRVRVRRVQRNRCAAISLYDSGARDSDIAKLLRIPVGVIRGWIRKYRQHGKNATEPIPMRNGRGDQPVASSSSTSSSSPCPYSAPSSGLLFQTMPTATYWCPNPMRPQDPAAAAVAAQGGRQIYIAPLEVAFRDPEWTFGDQRRHGNMSRTVMIHGRPATMIDSRALHCHYVDNELMLAANYWSAPAPYSSNDPLDMYHASRAPLSSAQDDVCNSKLQYCTSSNSASSEEESTDQEATTPTKQYPDENENVVPQVKERRNTLADRADNYTSSRRSIPKRSRLLRYGTTYLDYMMAREKELNFLQKNPELLRQAQRWHRHLAEEQPGAPLKEHMKF